MPSRFREWTIGRCAHPWKRTEAVLFTGRMIGSRRMRLRSFLMIRAFGFGLAAQVLMGAAMATPMPATGTSVKAMTDCPGCGDGDNAAVLGGCAVACCWNMAAVPVQSVPVERVASPAFVTGHYDLHPGLSSRPDPYPPKSSLFL
jgi:hypothetical protein